MENKNYHTMTIIDFRLAKITEIKEHDYIGNITNGREGFYTIGPNKELIRPSWDKTKKKLVKYIEEWVERATKDIANGGADWQHKCYVEIAHKLHLEIPSGIESLYPDIFNN